jgi:hypothetical protein
MYLPYIHFVISIQFCWWWWVEWEGRKDVNVVYKKMEKHQWRLPFSALWFSCFPLANFQCFLQYYPSDDSSSVCYRMQQRWKRLDSHICAASGQVFMYNSSFHSCLCFLSFQSVSYSIFPLIIIEPFGETMLCSYFSKSSLNIINSRKVFCSILAEDFLVRKTIKNIKYSLGWYDGTHL